jgi:hypothetical protein
LLLDLAQAPDEHGMRVDNQLMISAGACDITSIALRTQITSFCPA